ncbi:ABC transporter ATP-binding protein [Actinoplanes sp. NPDC049265]|uniref:ABC transporter ATP-binding protein n=1 Tax=Actinoplanes sp. NPDC049265 TaxID=3363902 RepID=UPI0037169259
MVAVRLEALTKVFDPGTVAVDDVTLEIPSGEFLVLLGEPGSGKTTLLRLIAGLEAATGGTIEVGDEPDAVVAVFQSYSVYQHLTVAQNIGFPLRGSTPDVGERVAEAARHLGIDDLLGRLPAHLSRGQRQRVAMARAIVRRPQVLLLDEPLSNVEPRVWAELRGDIVALTKRLGMTTIYVTHDRAEAVEMADRIVVIDHGKLVWQGFSPFTGLDRIG